MFMDILLVYLDHGYSMSRHMVTVHRRMIITLTETSIVVFSGTGSD